MKHGKNSVKEIFQSHGFLFQLQHCILSIQEQLRKDVKLWKLQRLLIMICLKLCRIKITKSTIEKNLLLQNNFSA